MLAVSVMLRELSSFNISAAQLACYDNEHCRGQLGLQPHHKVTGGFFTLFYVISPLLSSGQPEISCLQPSSLLVVMVVVVPV